VTQTARSRADRCPGVLRPWPASDGGLVRIRTVGGEITRAGLGALGEVASRYGDGELHLTKRANLQLRGLPLTGDGSADKLTDRLTDQAAEALLGTGLIPSPAHELVRNVMVSPLTGIDGGRADLRPVARELDRLICADAALAGLPGRFLFVLDDGRGDLLARPLDLGLVALDSDRVQLRAGLTGWGPVVALEETAARLVELAHRFLAVRGEGAGAAWHVDELQAPLLGDRRDPATEVTGGAASYGVFGGYEHRAIPGGVLTADLLAGVLSEASRDPIVVTPWHGLVLF
jgi:precorrin-3B synthase